MNEAPDVVEAVDEDGLTATEREYGKTPFGKLNEDQRMTAMQIREKRDNARYAANQAYRDQKAADAKAQYASAKA